MLVGGNGATAEGVVLRFDDPASLTSASDWDAEYRWDVYDQLTQGMWVIR